MHLSDGLTLWAALFRPGDSLRTNHMTRNPFSKALAIVLTLLMLQPVVLGAAQSSPQLPDPGKPGLNREQQIQLGLQARSEVYKQMPVLPDSNPVSRYVQQLGRKLAREIPSDRSWPYEFHVVQAADINAFALPGGPIFVNLGTIQAADNEAELAGVGIQFGAGTMLMKYTRKDEAQADAVGAIIMYNAGYNPKSLSDFFAKLEQRYGAGGPQFLSDHPNPGNREQAIQREIQNWPRKNYLSSNNAFLQVKQETKGIKAYTAQEISQGAQQHLWEQHNRQNGSMPAGVASSSGNGNGTISNVSAGQVTPSGQLREYQGPGFTISYPDNWQVNSDNSSVTIAPNGGTSGGNVAYGVIISAIRPANGSDINQATEDLIAGLIQSNSGMRRIGTTQDIRVNGIIGRSAELEGNS